MLEVRTLAGIRRDVFSIQCTLPLCPLWLTGLAAIQVNLHKTRHSYYSETKQLHIDIQRESQHTQRARPRGTPLVNSDHGWEHSWQKHLSDEKKKSKLVNNCPSFIALRTEHMKTTPAQTGLLTPWCRVLLEKLTGSQLVKKFPAFHGTRRFITALTSVRHLSLSWASPILSIYPHSTS